MRAAGKLVSQAFELLQGYIKPGVSLSELNRIAEDFILSRGAQTLYKGYNGNDPHQPPFPGTICASVNEVICHGIPDDRQLQDGDIVGIDIGLRLNGYCGDSCMTFGVGSITPQAAHLLEVSKACLQIGIEACSPGAYLGDIGNAVQSFAETQGVSVVREYGGHGIGKNLHEPPSISHVRMQSRGLRMRPGLVFTIEPMINLGTHRWKLKHDLWTVVTQDGKLSAQFEHTLAIVPGGVEILSIP